MPRLESFFWAIPSYSHQLSKNERLLFFVRVLREIQNNTTVLFLPIFLYLMANDLPWLHDLKLTGLQTGVVVIAGFFCIQRVVTFLTAIPLSKIMLKSKHETSMIFSYLIRTVMFAALYFSTIQPQLLIVAAVLEGLQANFFWNSFFTIVAKHLVRKPTVKTANVHQFLIQIAVILSPALSGYLAYRYGLEIVFLIGCVLSLASAAVLMMTSFHIPQVSMSWQDFFAQLKKPSFIKDTAPLTGRYINDAIVFLWPLYIYLVLGTVDRVGFLFTLSLFIALLAFYFVGGYIAALSSSKKSVLLSGGLLIAVWVARVQLITAWGMVAITAFEKLFATNYWRMFDMAFIQQAKGSKIFSYFVYKEMMISLVATAFWLICASLFLLTSPWMVIFIFAGIGVLLSMILSNGIHEKKSFPAVDV